MQAKNTTKVLDLIDKGASVNNTNDNNNSLLYEAIKLDDINSVIALLKRGANPKQMCGYGVSSTPLKLAKELYEKSDEKNKSNNHAIATLLETFESCPKTSEKIDHALRSWYKKYFYKLIKNIGIKKKHRKIGAN